MANVLYDRGREGFLAGEIDWDADDVRAILISVGYVFSTAHSVMTSIAPAWDNGRSVALGSKTVTAGVADAADTTATASSATSTIAVAIYKYNAADGSARLIAYNDTGVGLPCTPAAGQTINVVFDNGVNRIFKL